MSCTTKGQSEVIGVVILLSITMLSIGVIIAFAEPTVNEGTDIVDSSQMDNEFSLLDSRLATSALGASGSQRTDLNVNDGRISAEPEGATMTLYHNYTEADAQDVNSTLDNFVSVLNTAYGSPCSGGGGCTNDNWDDTGNIDDVLDALNETLVEIEMGKIEYTKDDEMLAYEGGGVWSKSEGDNGSVMVSPPEFHYARQGQTLTLPLFNVTSNFSAEGDRRGFEVGTSEEPDIRYEDNPVVGGSIRAEVESEYYRAWADYFDTRTEGSIDEDNIDDENNTASVALEVPKDTDIDGGHAFQGSIGGDSGYFDGDPSENEFFLSASEYIEDTLNEASGDNNNSDTGCIDSNQLTGDCTRAADDELTADGGDAVYYVDGEIPNSQEIDFDISDGNVTLAVDDEIDLGGSTEFDIVDNSSTEETRVEIMTQDDLEVGGNGHMNPDGNTSEMVFFAHSSIDIVRIDGSSADEFDFTVYAPNSLLQVNGMGNVDWSGAIVASGTDSLNGPKNNQIGEGSPVNLELGAATDTITYLHVTENEVFIEPR